MDIAALFSSVNQAVTLGKALVEIRDQAAMNTKVIEFQQAIMTVQQKAMELQAEQQSLLNRIHALEEECRAHREIEGVTYEAPYYWRTADEKKDGPFCQSCYDKDRKLVRLQGDGEGYWQCNVCKNGVTDSSFKPATVSRDYDPY